MPVILSYGSPAIRDPIEPNGSSPPGAESIGRKKRAGSRFRRLRGFRIYTISGNSGHISPRDVGDDKIQPPAVTPASVASPAPFAFPPPIPHPAPVVLPARPLPPLSNPATNSHSSSHTQHRSASSTHITSHSTSTSDQYYQEETSSSALGTSISSSPTTLATSKSCTLPCSTGSAEASQASNMVTLKSGAQASDRNTAITGGIIGGISAFLGLMFLIFLFRRSRLFEPLKRFASSRRKQGISKPKTPSGSISRQISTALDPPSNPPMASTMTWNYEETFANPSDPPPSRLSRIFRGPLSLHPPTPPPVSTKFQPPESLARTIFRNSHISPHTMLSPTQPKGASVHTRSSVALPHRYDRLPSVSFTGEDSEERRAMSYFSRTSTTTARPQSPPSASQRQSQATMKSAHSEPARFRSVPSWVNDQSQRQMWISQRGLDSEENQNPVPENPVPENPVPENPVPENPVPENPVPENPVPENPVPENPLPENPVPENPEGNKYSVKTELAKTTSVKRKPARLVIQSMGKTQGDEGEGTGNVVFEEHPGTRVEVPGLQGKRIRSTVLDRNMGMGDE